MNGAKVNTPVSVIIPAFNIENYIVETIESLLSQSVKPQEIIIIDDGSTDNTKGILLERYEGNGLIKIISQENKGAGEARNHGVSLACGDYIFFCDSDDIVLPGFFETFDGKLREDSNIDMFCFSSEFFYENGYKGNKTVHHASGWLPSAKIALSDLLVRNSYTAASWTYIIRKNIITDNGLKFYGRLHEDHIITMSAYLISKATYRTENILYSQRVREGSLTRSKHIIDFSPRIDALNSTLNVLDKIVDVEKSEIQLIRARYVNSSLFFLIDMCADTCVFLPSIVLDTFKCHKKNTVFSLKEKFLLNFPELYFALKKIYIFCMRPSHSYR
ncbi:probable glycosyl transferase [Methylomonas albis]|uniref:Glycosyltransferase family 2 protein n=1 Tax=Methylomonas albis TaxID=1854563 RepID=A0ABR9D5K5_9GAMM|nr:glycosyltransferase family A protein [Methylomonas albis]MBD9358415.1 glycosyltransferase family 2 protein [Methylomonas albis]CAD6881817.1 probable glycosyl transferase [Methylomonas albis]